MGTLYFQGKGVNKDQMLGLRWTERAAQQGDVAAQTNYFLMCQGDIDAPQESRKQSLIWLRNAAELGHAQAQSILGSWYAQGAFGVSKDDAEAFKWYRNAADQGHKQAQFDLGLMYVNERGVPKDNAEALKWFRKAADQGHATAGSMMGQLYECGEEGLPADESEAARWYKQAAKHGDIRSTFALAKLIARGYGECEPDPDLAIKMCQEQYHYGKPVAGSVDGWAEWIVGFCYHTRSHIYRSDRHSEFLTTAKGRTVFVIPEDMSEKYHGAGHGYVDIRKGELIGFATWMSMMR